MYKTIFVVLALALFAFGEDIITFHEAPADTVFSVNEEKGYIYSYPEDHDRQSFIPPDIGGNWGDNIMYLGAGKLEVHEVRINVKPAQSDQTFIWTYSTNRTITAINTINLGRQRAYVRQIKMPSDRKSCEATIAVRNNTQMRLLMEVYGTSAAQNKLVSWFVMSLTAIICVFMKMV